jgi:hypothetical protein
VGADGIAPTDLPRADQDQIQQALWQDEHIKHQVLDHQPIRRIGVPEDISGWRCLRPTADTARAVYMADGGYLS